MLRPGPHDYSHLGHHLVEVYQRAADFVALAAGEEKVFVVDDGLGGFGGLEGADLVDHELFGEGDGGGGPCFLAEDVNQLVLPSNRQRLQVVFLRRRKVRQEETHVDVEFVLQGIGHLRHELGEHYEFRNRGLKMGGQLYQRCRHFLLNKGYQRL